MRTSTNLDLATQLYAAFRAQDYATFRDLCDPAIQWRQNPGFPGGGVHIGPEAVITNVFGAFANRWERFGFAIDSMFDAGDAVFVTGAYRGTALGTGLEAVAETCHVLRFTGGKVSHFQQYTDTKVLWDALEPA